MWWVWASLPWSTRSSSWLPSRPSEPRSSKCTAVVCRSNADSTTTFPLLPLLQPTNDRLVMLRETKKREKDRKALPDFPGKTSRSFWKHFKLPHAFLDPYLPFVDECLQEMSSVPSFSNCTGMRRTSCRHVTLFVSRSEVQMYNTLYRHQSWHLCSSDSLLRKHMIFVTVRNWWTGLETKQFLLRTGLPSNVFVSGDENTAGM